MLDQPRFLAWPETRQHQHGLLHSSPAHGDALLRARDAEPVRAGLLERPSYLRPAVAVAIALNDAQNFSRSFASYFRRVYELADGLEVFRERAKRNLRPNRTPCFFAVPLLYGGHGPSEKFSLRHPAGASA